MSTMSLDDIKKTIEFNININKLRPDIDKLLDLHFSKNMSFSEIKETPHCKKTVLEWNKLVSEHKDSQISESDEAKKVAKKTTKKVAKKTTKKTTKKKQSDMSEHEDWQISESDEPKKVTKKTTKKTYQQETEWCEWTRNIVYTIQLEAKKI